VKPRQIRQLSISIQPAEDGESDSDGTGFDGNPAPAAVPTGVYMLCTYLNYDIFILIVTISIISRLAVFQDTFF